MNGPVAIVGGGVAGATAARTLAAKGYSGPIHLFSDEPLPPYSRPKMIDYLKGAIERDRLPLFPASWYREHGVTLHLGTEVTGVDLTGGRLSWSSGVLTGCHRIILAAGGDSRRLSVPGGDADDVIAWRTAEDADRIIAGAISGKETVVVGGGVLGVETAMALAARGAFVTVVQYTDRLCDLQLDSGAAAMLDRFVRRAGVRTAFGVDTARIADGFVEAKDGRRFPAGMVVMAAGMKSRTALAKAAGLLVEKGVVIDDRCRTSHAVVYACGDVAQFSGVVFGIVPAAAEQGRVAAENVVAEGSARYAGTVPSNMLKVAGLSLLSAGIQAPPHGAEESHVVEVRSDPGRDLYLKAILRENRVVGAIWLGTDRGARTIAALVTGGAPSTLEEIRGIMDEAFS